MGFRASVKRLFKRLFKREKQEECEEVEVVPVRRDVYEIDWTPEQLAHFELRALERGTEDLFFFISWLGRPTCTIQQWHMTWYAIKSACRLVVPISFFEAIEDACEAMAMEIVFYNLKEACEALREETADDSICEQDSNLNNHPDQINCQCHIVISSELTVPEEQPSTTQNIYPRNIPSVASKCCWPITSNYRPTHQMCR